MIEPCCHRFTAAEGGARLAATASNKNTLITECASFISTRLLHEEAYSIRGLLSSGKKRSVRICRRSNVKPDAYELRILTDLKIAEAEIYDDVEDWSQELEVKEVLVCTSEVLKKLLEGGLLKMVQINVLVIDSCHLIYSDLNLKYIMQTYKQTNEQTRPRILAITYPLFSSSKDTIDNEDIDNSKSLCPVNTIDKTDTVKTRDKKETIDKKDDRQAVKTIDSKIDSIDNKCDSFDRNDRDIEIGNTENLDDFNMYENLEWKIDDLEKELCCTMDLAEDIDGCKRLSGPVPKPKELIIEYSLEQTPEGYTAEYIELATYMKDGVTEVLNFLMDHRHDPTEIYGDELYEEFKNIPDPAIEPIIMLKEFLYVLEELGPYAADKAAFSLLIKLEKLKIKVPYERHFLLLRLCTTILVKIRCYYEHVMCRFESEWDKIRLFSTPKLMRLVEILEKFTPTDASNQSNENNDNHEGNNQNNQLGKKHNIHLGNNEVGNIQLRNNEVGNIHLGNENSPINDIDNQLNNINLDINTNEETKEQNIQVRNNQIGNTQLGNNQLGNIQLGNHNQITESDSHSVTKSDISNTNNNKVNALLKAIEKCDFTSLGNRIEDKLNTIQGDLKDLDGDVNLDLRKDKDDGVKPRRGRGGRRARGRRAAPGPAALAGIVYMNEPIMAKILFMVVAELTRCRSTLSYISCQYCAVEPTTDTQKQGKRHEEVLKKFRMHECNLLLTTQALEEGVDLPRCNLVLRWDLPSSYRSHILCRSRGRAPRSTAVLLCPATDTHTDMLLHNLAVYTELDQIISRKCGCGIQDEPTLEEESEADIYNTLIKPYSPTHKQTNKEKTHKQKQNQMKKQQFDRDIVINKQSVKDGVSHSIFDSAINKQDGVINKQDSGKNNRGDKDEVRNKQDSVINNRSNKDSAINNHNDKQIQIENNFKQLKIECEQKSDRYLNKEHVSELKIDSGDSKRFSDIKVNSDSKNVNSDIESVASVDLNSAIALINRYCAKLPSDTFTRLAPQWWMERVRLPGEAQDAYICTLRLPLNCPVKYNIVGHPMASLVLARRVAALQACRILHRSGELDDQLMPIGKENFKAAELENSAPNGNSDRNDLDDAARPGTTKRRQYYYKRTASAFTDCQPVIDTSDTEIDHPEEAEKRTDTQTDTKTDTQKDTGGKRNKLYLLQCVLQCALPERYNTRGRRLHAPQHAPTALALLMAASPHHNMQIPSFPVYTRSGEVRVSVEHIPDADVRMSPRRGRLVRRFMRFVFNEVLRVRRKGMKLQSEGSTKNNYYIVPTIKTTKPDGSTKIDIDWPFLELIYQHTEEKKLLDIEKPMVWRQDGEEGKKRDEKLVNPLLKEGEVFVFDAEKYKEAVVTPWYRNQDQPQFFLVAEICWNLCPDSAFPSCSHSTFRSYYRTKYRVELTQPEQPLLDVDHTSARLNLLTPRYVNRKGVALPVSSERTRRAKRDRLDQKQILVPELCATHPFAAPLWFATVALPCVLYRINALLIADEIRRAVALDVGLGIPHIDENTMPDFQWPPLDFGWSLAEVLSADAEKNEKKKEEEKEHKSKEKEFRDKMIGDNKEDFKEEKVSNEIEVFEQNPEKTINDILQEKEDAESGFEIGTWSNDMASSIPDSIEFDELLEPLPSNLTFCTSASGGVNWCDPIQKPKSEYNTSRNYDRTFSMADSDCSFMSSDFDTDDSEFDSEGSDDDADGSGFCNSKNSNAAVGVRIEYKTAHEAEAVDVGNGRKCIPAPARDIRQDIRDRARLHELLKGGGGDGQYIERFNKAVEKHKQIIKSNGDVITKDNAVTELLPETKIVTPTRTDATIDYKHIFPYKNEELTVVDGKITIDSIERNKRRLLAELKKSLSADEVKELQCFSMVDVDIDSPNFVNEKIVNIGFDSKEKYEEKIMNFKPRKFVPYFNENKNGNFDFDYQPDLEGHPGPSPSVILQALTMSNANDGINLERLETIGDSFLKFAITAYLYCAHPTVHEGKLSHMRSKQVSNLNLYRLGRGVRLGARMIASKFEPHDNWLPPCHRPPHPHKTESKDGGKTQESQDASGCYIPYNLITQHSIPDKSVADCVEALIGAYLVEAGARGALVFMSWLGIRVLPHHVLKVDAPPPEQKPEKTKPKSRPRRPRTASSSSSSSSSSWCESGESDDELGLEGGVPGMVGATAPTLGADGEWTQLVYGELKAPPSPLLRYIEDPEGELEQMLSGYEELERTLDYRFRDRSLLLQALTHASHHSNRLTDCYQRLEFLGDAILDYLITRHLFEDKRRHTPGALTDLRSALVNNTIFATLAVRHGFHKFFRHMSPGLNEVLTKYVKIQEENGHSISEEHYLIQEDELEQAEDVEVPKALGDLFESVAGAIFLDSGMSLGAVWRSYVRLMGAELEAFSAAAPKSPVRELLEAEPDTAKFGKPERLADGRRVRVCVEVFGRGTFKGIGRNYRIAKGTAARCALRHLKIHRR